MDEKHGQMLDNLRVQVHLMVVQHVRAVQGDVPPPRPAARRVGTWQLELGKSREGETGVHIGKNL